MAVDIDLAKFFDTVNHDVLMKIMGRTIHDKALLGLIGRYLRAGVVNTSSPATSARPKAGRYRRSWPRTKIKNLRALGVSLKTAIQHGVSSKSCWHMARTPATQQALSNDWLTAQGLLSIKTLWCKAQGYSS